MESLIRVICPDWGVGHGPLVLREGAVPASHGMCDRCVQFMDLDTRRAIEYRVYMHGILDPRD